MVSKPLVSVIIPVFNCERYIAEAIESVLAQTYRPIEIIVIDDGSTDGTANIVKSFKEDARYFYQPNSGPPVARNKGLRMAKGNVISFLDADDLWSKNKLKIQLSHLSSDSSEIILGHEQLIYQIKGVNGKPDLEVFPVSQFTFCLGSGVYRRSVFDKVGFFDETLFCCDDWDWFKRARELGISMVIIQEVTLFYRRHRHNLTNQKELETHYMIRMLKRSIDRRREQNNGQVTLLKKLSDYKEKRFTGKHKPIVKKSSE